MFCKSAGAFANSAILCSRRSLLANPIRPSRRSANYKIETQEGHDEDDNDEGKEEEQKTIESHDKLYQHTACGLDNVYLCGRRHGGPADHST
jgi:hypothetical protein